MTSSSTSSSSLLLDLYRDVLYVSPDVSDREIRIAYFRRGREILGEASALSGLSSSKNNNSNNNINNNNKLDPETKLKFQAVSMAYELLSTPEWKEIYLRQGGLKLTMKNKDKRNNNINNDRRTRGNDNGGDGDDEIRTMTTDTDATRTTSSKPEREEQQQRQHDDLFSSSPSAVAAAFPTINTTVETNSNGGLVVVPAVKNTNNNNNKIVRNNEVQFPLNTVQQQQQLIQNEFQQQQQQQQQQQAIPIVKRLPTALRKSSFTGRDNGNNDNASCTSSSSIKIKNKRISRRTGTTTSSSVRWNDHVEELIFANHPNEHACSDSEDDDDTDDDDDDNDDGYDDDDDNIDIDDRTEDDDIVEEEERNHRQQQQTRKNKKKQDGTFPRLIGSGGGDNNSNNNSGTTNQNGESYSVTIKSPASVSGHSSSHRSVSNSTTGSNSKRSNNRNKNKKKPKIVIDSEELESHLKRMDNEAEKHFVQDFWDNFEESMDGIMSLVDSLGGDASKKSKNKGGNNKRSASSWSSSILSSSKQQQRGRRNKNNNAAAGTISRSMSHDLISTSSTIYEEDEDAILKRSNSFPEGTMSQHELVSLPQQQKSNTLSSSLGAAKVVTPDHHHHHHDQNTSSKRLDPPTSEMQSPYEMVLNSWPFQSSSQNQQQQQVEYATSSTTTPAVVSPQSAGRMTKSTIQDSYPQSSSHRLTVISPPSDAATSLASDILSQQQLKQKLFRPISPALSEASEAITSGFDGGSSNSNNNDDNNRSLLSDDKFELGSRISEMDSLDLTEFDNPFRQQPLSSSPIKCDSTSNAPLLPPPADVAMPISKSKNSQSELDEEKKVDFKSKLPPNDTNNAATATTATKKGKFRVSMTSRTRGISYDKEQQPLSHDQVAANKNGRASRTSRAESMEDVFAGVDEGSKQQQQRCDVIDNNRRPLNLQDISIERSASHVSDLSESVYTSNKKSEDDEDGERILYESRIAEDPIVVSVSEAATVTFAPSTISSSVMSSSTKKSIMMNNSTTRSSVRSEASTGYSSYASSTRDTNSVYSLESAAVDSSGFFDYFIRYVTAIMTECANMGPTNGAPAAEYQQDFMSLFSTEKSAHNKAEIPVKAEVLEQPSSMKRVPSSSTCSTSSSRGSEA